LMRRERTPRPASARDLPAIMTKPTVAIGCPDEHRDARRSGA
jgi:hypothetical protein